MVRRMWAGHAKDNDANEGGERSAPEVAAALLVTVTVLEGR